MFRCRQIKGKMTLNIQFESLSEVNGNSYCTISFSLRVFALCLPKAPWMPNRFVVSLGNGTNSLPNPPLRDLPLVKGLKGRSRPLRTDARSIYHSFQILAVRIPARQSFPAASSSTITHYHVSQLVFPVLVIQGEVCRVGMHQGILHMR